MDRFAELATFVHVVDAGGISRAAEREGIAKSAVSRRLVDLERRLGAQLLTRTTRQLTPTEVGRGFYDRCRTLLADLEEAEWAVADSHRAVGGTLRIAVPVTFGVMHLGPLLTEFMQAHPAMEVDVDFSDRRVNVIEEGYDLALRIGRLHESSMVARRICAIEHAVAASPGYLASHGTPRTPRELARHRCLRYSLEPNGARWSYRAPDGTRGEIELEASVTASNGEFLRDAAIAGHGIVREPTFIIYRAIRDGELVPLLPDHHWSSIALHAVYPPTRRLARRVRVFIDFLAERLGDAPYWDAAIADRLHPGGSGAD